MQRPGQNGVAGGMFSRLSGAFCYGDFGYEANRRTQIPKSESTGNLRITIFLKDLPV